MDFDFEFFLVAASVLTGFIWAGWAVYLKLRSPVVTEQTEPWPVEYAKSFFPVIFIVLLLRAFLVEPFRIPSGSMMPTLLIGDFILVNKFTYGVRLPVLHTKIIENGQPKRGDIVVFRFPNDTSVDYIKRVVGLPGDLSSILTRISLLTAGPSSKPFSLFTKAWARVKITRARRCFPRIWTLSATIY